MTVAVKGGSMVLDNFTSTDNLTSNPGYQSTLSIASTNVQSEEKKYNPFEHRQVAYPNSTFGSLAHLLKSSLGSGILAMPVAFKNAGLASGAVGTIVLGIICTHCVHVLVRTSQEVCVEAKKPSMGFAETCEAAFTYGPKPLRRWASFIKSLVDYSMAATYFGALCVYVVFIGASFKEVFDVYFPEYKLSAAAYCALTLLPLVVICQIRNLKYLVPFSALANVLLVVTFAITMYYLFTDLPHPREREMVASVSQWPLFISTVIFAMEGIGVVMPVENEMAKPQHFLGCPGVLNTAMIIVVSLYGTVGVFGYLKYGDEVKGSVTLNLPQDELVAQSAKILMALAILFTYSLQFYVPIEMIWRRLGPRVSTKYHNITQVTVRTLIVTCSVAIAAAFPNLELVISLVGAIFFSTLGLLTPAVVETVHKWNKDLGPCLYVVFKNGLIGAIALVALISGSFTSVRGMIREFGGSDVKYDDI